MKVFIDLESTVIDTWDSMNLYGAGIRQIKNFLDFSVDEIDELFIFSYAVYDIDDQIFFKKHIKPLLEEVFKVKVNMPLTIKEYMVIANGCLGLKMSQEDFFDFMKKDIFFPIFIQWYAKDKPWDKYVLFDDMVINMKVSNENYTIHMIQVN
jgi:hypothetical protein